MSVNQAVPEFNAETITPETGEGILEQAESVEDVGEQGESVDTSADMVEDIPAATGSEKEVDLLGEDVPEWLKEYDGLGRSFKVSKDDLERIYNHEDKSIGQVLHNFRRQATNAVRSVAEEKKALLQRERQLNQQEEHFVQERSKLSAIFQNPELQKLVMAPSGPPPADEFSEEGRSWFAQKEVASRIGPIINAIAKSVGDEQQRFEESYHARVMEERKAELQSFIDSKPDFESLREDIVTLRGQRNNMITAEEAYHLVKARKTGGASQRAAKPRVQTPVDKARAVARGVGVKPRAEVPQQPPDLSAVQLAEWWEKNPDAYQAMQDEAYATFRR